MASTRATHRALRRPSFTLVELLVAIAIIGVMAGMVLYSLAGAQRDAKIARTRGTIQKLNEILLQRWEEYRYRAVKLNVPPEWLIPNPDLPVSADGQPGQPMLTPREGARLRMIALRDAMRMEMPDRYTDLLYPPTRYAARVNSPTGVIATYTDATGLGRAVPQGYNQLRNYFGFVSLPANYTIQAIPKEDGRVGSNPAPTYENQQAELLYAIVAMSNYNGGSALESFRPSEIADTDGDGFLEFVDAWGQPIRWIRWPAGYEGNLNQSYRQLEHDGMDPQYTDWRWLRSYTDQRPWTLVPLVVSAGPDGAFDMVFDPADSSGEPTQFYATKTWDSPPAPNYGMPYYNVDPYFTFTLPAESSLGNTVDIPNLQIGSPVDADGDGIDGGSDNITNHQLLLE